MKAFSIYLDVFVFFSFCYQHNFVFFIEKFEIRDKRPRFKWSKYASVCVCVCRSSYACTSVAAAYSILRKDWAANSAHCAHITLDCLLFQLIVFSNQNWWVYFFLFQWIETNPNINPIRFGVDIFICDANGSKMYASNSEALMNMASGIYFTINGVCMLYVCVDVSVLCAFPLLYGMFFFCIEFKLESIRNRRFFFLNLRFILVGLNPYSDVIVFYFVTFWLDLDVSRQMKINPKKYRNIKCDLNKINSIFFG